MPGYGKLPVIVAHDKSLTYMSHCPSCAHEGPFIPGMRKGCPSLPPPQHTPLAQRSTLISTKMQLILVLSHDTQYSGVSSTQFNVYPLNACNHWYVSKE